MKVLHVLAQLPVRTGSGVYYTNLIDGLSHDTDLIQGAIYGIQSPYQVDLNVAYENPVVFKTETLPFPIAGMSDEMPYENTVYSQMTDAMVEQWQQAFLERLNHAKEHFQPDIIIAHHLWYLTSMIVELFPNIPIVGVCHGTDIRQTLQHPILAERYVKHLDQLALVFALSDKDKAQIHQLYQVPEEKIFVSAAGFNQQLFNTEGVLRSHDSIEVVYAGKIAHAKGVYQLAQAYPALKQRYPMLKFSIIGSIDDKNRDLLYNYAEHLDDFNIFDVKSQAHLAEYMKQADIFVLPSYYEGMGLIAIEALACQMRVVVTEIEGLMELLGPTVNQSDVIEYVGLPRLKNQDEPYEEDIPAYVKRLEAAIAKQIDRTLEGIPFDDRIYQRIIRHSWGEVTKQQLQRIKQLV